jgi:hypothetical protein
MVRNRGHIGNEQVRLSRETSPARSRASLALAAAS